MNKITQFGIAAVAAAALSTTLVACDSGNTDSTPAVGTNVTTANQVQDQQENLTVQGYNTAMKNILDQYPAKEMSDPLELQMLRERDLYLNDPNRTMYVYFFPAGRTEVLYSTVRGKISSMSSQMTATHGIYKDANGYQSSGGGNVPIDLPQDDLSYGGTEFGDNGIFWFDTKGGFHEVGSGQGLVMIESSPLPLNAIEMPAQAMPQEFLNKLATAK